MSRIGSAKTSQAAGTVLDLIGNTPLVSLQALSPVSGVTLVGKLEAANPGRSVKDRIASAMVEDAERRGLLAPGDTLVEPTSGNTGVGLAMVCAAKGYRLVLTMPETMSWERRKLLAAYGAEIVLTPGDQGMRGAVERARRIAAELSAFVPQQFSNRANPGIHAETTAEEIWADTGGELDFLVSGVGTGGTLTGIASALRPRLPGLKVVAVEPCESDVLSGGMAGPHRIQGIGAGFVPEVLDIEEIDEVRRVSYDDARETARLLARRCGVLSGISSGAAVAAALAVVRDSARPGRSVLAILPDTGERYLSTGLFEEEAAAEGATGTEARERLRGGSR